MQSATASRCFFRRKEELKAKFKEWAMKGPSANVQKLQGLLEKGRKERELL